MKKYGNKRCYSLIAPIAQAILKEVQYSLDKMVVLKRHRE